MSRLLSRIIDTGADIYRRVSGSSVALAPAPAARAGTVSDYELRDMMLDGRIYLPSTSGGALKTVLRSLGRPCNSQDEAKYPVAGYFNPVKSICSFYSHSFGGRLGADLVIDDEVNDRPVNPRLPDVLRLLWRWTNLDHRAAELTTIFANHGTVGIRVVYSADPSPRVYLDFDPPAFVKRADLDNRGNVVTVFLEYTGQRHDADGNVDGTFKVEEIISKYGFSQKFDGDEQLTPEQQENGLGVCPYVLLRNDVLPGETFGRHAYHGSERAIHGINFGLSQLDQSVIDHVWPYIFGTGPGKKPNKFTTGRYTMVYVQSEGGKPDPSVDLMVPRLDFKGAIEHLKGLADLVRDRQPQMVLNALSLLSGISGETLAQVLKPAEAESLRARVLIEDAVIRASALGISAGIYNRVPGFDLGTGGGSKDAADAAYGDGDGPEAFRFKTRPALPPTVYQRIEQAKADDAVKASKLALMGLAEGVSAFSEDEVFRIGGYTDAEIAAIKAERATETPDDEDGVDTVGGDGGEDDDGDEE
jgi:hypothetical protein